MKKLKLPFVALATIVTSSLVIWSCVKEEPTPKQNVNPEQKSEATVKVVKLSTKSGEETVAYVMTSYVGHLGYECNWKCMTLGGIVYHADCSGFGRACLVGYAVTPVEESKIITKSTEQKTFSLLEIHENSISHEKTYNFPARSFKMQDGSERWLNVPAQILEKEDKMNLFVFKGAYYSETPAFMNE